MGPGKRAIRRHHIQRIRAKIERFVRSWYKGKELIKDPEFMGRMISTHGCPCSCEGCANRKDGPRKRGVSENFLSDETL